MGYRFIVVILDVASVCLALLQLLKVTTKSVTEYRLTEEGHLFVANGSYEYILFQSIPEDGILQSKLMVSFTDFTIVLYISVIVVVL